MRKNFNRSELLPGLVLILLGAWLLLPQLGISLPGLQQLWPVFIILGGLSNFWQYFTGRERDSGKIFSAVAAIGLGLFFLLFTLTVRLPVLGRINWEDMPRLWPTFLLIGGTALLGRFVASVPKQYALAWNGLLTIIIGLVLFAFTLNFFSMAWLGQWWPVLLILAGITILTQTMLGRR